jgi:Zn-dependent peptidase ImmA (M78 family)/transcriptional regulator with XRE-family HTH domain
VRLSQTVVGRRLDVTRQTIGSYERSERTPGLQQLGVMANLYRLTLDELVGGVMSVAQPQAGVRYMPRFNDAAGLSGDDLRELRGFDTYLQRRPGAHPEIRLARGTFESIEQLVDRWRGTTEPMLAQVPVPIFEFLMKVGVEVRFTAMDELAGALIPGSEARPAGIVINSDQPYDRERWTAAHEVGHLVLQHDPDQQRCETGRRFQPAEVQADQFASELLMPAREIPRQAEVVEARLRGLPGLRTAHSVLLLGRQFLVSYQAMLVRLGQLGALPPDDVEALRREKPTKLLGELGASEGQGTKHFAEAALPGLAAKSMPNGWQSRADAEAVRLLQTIAYLDYLTNVREADRADGAAEVYEKVALWVADMHPIVRL